MVPKPFLHLAVATSSNNIIPKDSFSVLPLTPPQSSHSASDAKFYTPPYTSIFSDFSQSNLTPTSTLIHSNPPLFALARHMPPPVLRFPGLLPDPDLPKYYASKNSNPLTYALNNDLLHIVTLLGPGFANPNILHEALRKADSVLVRATQHELWDMVSKCHYYRGIIFIELLNWEKARKAFTRAATIRSWGGWIEGNMKIIAWGEEMERRGLVWDLEDRARTLSYTCSQAW